MANSVAAFLDRIKQHFARRPVGCRAETAFPSLVQRWWGTIPSHLPFYILVPVLAYALWYGLQPATVIAPFHLPSENKEHPLPFSGEAVADAVQDAITSIRQEAGGAAPPPPCDFRTEKEEMFGGLKAQASSAFEVRGPVTVEVKGISPEAVKSAAREIFDKERYVSGDVILDGPATFRLLAQANDSGPWLTKPQEISLDGLRWASCELAERILGAVNKDVLAAALIRRGKYDDVIALYGSLPSQSGDPDALNNLGVALRVKCHPADPGVASTEAELKCLGAPVVMFHQALATRWRFPEAHYNLGVALDENGQTDDAIAEYREAIKLKPDYADAHINLGGDLRDKGQTDNAIAEYREAIKLRPDYAMAHSNLGNALLDKHQTDDAIAEYREAIKLEPDFADAHIGLGVALQDKGQTDDAIAEYREAIKLKPNYAMAHNNLGDAMLNNGQTDAAIAEFREAIRLKPDYQLARDNLAKALNREGQ